jgi:signal peptidase I
MATTTEKTASTEPGPQPVVEQPGFFSFENIKSLSVLILVILALRWSVASPYHVPTASMEPTIKVGDRLLAFKLAYNLKIPFTDIVVAKWADVARGDIIVFRFPNDPDIDYVKRVVGVAGDKIEMIDDFLYVNGQKQERVDKNQDREVLDDIEDTKEVKMLYQETLDGHPHWVMQNIPSAQRAGRPEFPAPGQTYVVPEDSVYCMGDNRDNSRDSRYWGRVPLSYVRGKALFVIWSIFSPPGDDWPRFRFGRFGHWLDS